VTLLKKSTIGVKKKRRKERKQEKYQRQTDLMDKNDNRRYEQLKDKGTMQIRLTSLVWHLKKRRRQSVWHFV